MTPELASILLGIISGLLALLLALLRYTVAQKEKELDGKIEEMRLAFTNLKTYFDGIHKFIETRLIQEELATRTLHGDLALLKQSLDGLQSDLERNITRVEFEAKLDSLDKMLAMILQKYDNSRAVVSGMSSLSKPLPPRK